MIDVFNHYKLKGIELRITLKHSQTKPIIGTITEISKHENCLSVKDRDGNTTYIPIDNIALFVEIK